MNYEFSLDVAIKFVVWSQWKKKILEIKIFNLKVPTLLYNVAKTITNINTFFFMYLSFVVESI